MKHLVVSAIDTTTLPQGTIHGWASARYTLVRATTIPLGMIPLRALDSFSLVLFSKLRFKIREYPKEVDCQFPVDRRGVEGLFGSDQSAPLLLSSRTMSSRSPRLRLTRSIRVQHRTSFSRIKF